MNLEAALRDKLWLSHKISDSYNMDGDTYKIAYYPLFGTYKGGVWVDFEEPRALVEKPILNGIDFREVPLRYLTKLNHELH